MRVRRAVIIPTRTSLLIPSFFRRWLFTEGDPLSSLANIDLSEYSNFDLQHLVSEFPSLGNFTEFLTPGR